jgi:hypothetical protein
MLGCVGKTPKLDDEIFLDMGRGVRAHLDVVKADCDNCDILEYIRMGN